ncbi:hypothetical protein E3E31_08220 [Thermococcus sp. M39]|uniref:hypothetical protein n=1 Tax=unclassified Thermococcus TaxID=2627626 RepID=UPI00143A6E18|nr:MULTISPECIES: hypothetical protein [unclassified Thermococcus]NJE08506.1 hypothetical protein [Thermococcus sp. M39]NJE13841.1 hypothetical protein [Thermococcus sp. LS2]
MECVRNPQILLAIEGENIIIPTTLEELQMAFTKAIKDAMLSVYYLEVQDRLEALKQAIEAIFQKKLEEIDSEVLEVFYLNRPVPPCELYHIYMYYMVEEKFEELKHLLEKKGDVETLKRLEKFLEIFNKHKDDEIKVPVVGAFDILKRAIMRVSHNEEWIRGAEELGDKIKKAGKNRRALLAAIKELDTP